MSQKKALRLTERERFSYYLRTGFIAPEVKAEPAGQTALETKFNPYHDPENGRFTFAPGGPQSRRSVVTSWGKYKPKAVKPKKPQTVSGRHIDVPVSPTTKPIDRVPTERHPDGSITVDIPPASEQDAPDIIVTARRQNHEPKLGSLSSKYETGGRGPGTINNGRGDAGGPSYGSYQLAADTGTLKKFMDGPEFEAWKEDFAGLKPGTRGFDTKWKEIAENERHAFETAQHAFIQRTHYAPVVKQVEKLTSLNLDKRQNAVRQAVWSVSVQHAGASKILDRAVKAADQIAERNSAGYDKTLINKIYDARSNYVLAVASKAAPQNRAGLLNAVRIRYPQERKDALHMLRK